MQLDTVSPEEMRNMLFLGHKEGRFVNSYLVFETVRSQINLLLENSNLFDKNDKSVKQMQLNAWVFDRLFNGAWEYTHPDKKEENEFNLDYVNPYQSLPRWRAIKLVPKTKTTFWDIWKKTVEILGTDVDKDIVSNIIGGSMIFTPQEVSNDLLNPSETEWPISGWNPKNKPDDDTWGANIAIYGRLKQMLIANETYYRDMDTNLKELDALVVAWRFNELIDKRDHAKLTELLVLLSKEKSYKDQVLRASRTGKSTAWNSIGGSKSGSIRIGRDVTCGEIRALHSNGTNGFHLRGEELIAKFRQEALRLIDAVDLSSLSNYEKEEFSIKRIAIDTKLRVLLTCGSSLDQFWKHGPFLMNLFVGDIIYGNGNYVNLTWIPREVNIKELYSPEEIDRIHRKFEEWRTKGHYENSFEMTLKNGEKIMIPWHRYFPDTKKTNLANNISFGMGTMSVVRHMKS